MKVNHQARAAAASARRAKTREGLLQAAMRVIAEKGPDAASIEDFAAAAGVARGTFYNYFPTTADLISALNERLADELSQGMALPDDLDPALALALALHKILLTVENDPVRGWVGLRIEAAGARRPAAFDARFERVYLAGVRAGRFVDWGLTPARNLVFGASRMAQRDMLLRECEPDHAQQVIAVILAGLGVPVAEALGLSGQAHAAARLT